MQRFTIFSLILSISIILLISDIVSHNYFDKETYESATSGELVLEESILLEEREELEEAPPRTPVPVPAPAPQPKSEPEADQPVELSEIVILSARLTANHYSSAGFLDTVLKETMFMGRIFQFIDFSDQTDAFIYQSNVFEGERFLGSVYEIRYPTDTGAFQGYLALRERAMSLVSMGDVSEINNYGDSSFYFNHKVKTKTVHNVIRKGSSIYAFEYEHINHERMKPLYDLLP